MEEKQRKEKKLVSMRMRVGVEGEMEMGGEVEEEKVINLGASLEAV